LEQPAMISNTDKELRTPIHFDVIKLCSICSSLIV
jgi:hypothetical protein